MLLPTPPSPSWWLTALSLSLSTITIFASPTPQDIRTLTPLNGPKYECSAPFPPTAILPYESCRGAAKSFQEKFKGRSWILTHAETPRGRRIKTPYTIATDKCVFRVDYQANFEPVIGPTDVSMYGTLLADSCFKNEATLAEKGGGGKVELQKEALEGRFVLALGFEHPQIGGNYSESLSQEQVEAVLSEVPLEEPFDDVGTLSGVVVA